MTRDNTPLSAEIAARRERAKIVDAEYGISKMEDGNYNVTCPADPDRDYMVNLSVPTCTCMDFSCTSGPRGIYCKHIFAVQRRVQRENRQRDARDFPRPRLVDDAGFDRSKLPTDRVPTPEDVARAQGDPFEPI